MLERLKIRIRIPVIIICSLLLFIGCKTTNIIKNNSINNDTSSYSEILLQIISKLELSDYEKQHLFQERVFFNIDSNSLSFLFSKSMDADTARIQLNKLYSFNKIFNTIYKKDKAKFYPLTQKLNDFYYNQLTLYDCKINSFEVRSKCNLIKKALAAQSLNKIETFVGETTINLLSNYSIKTDPKLLFYKKRKVKYSILRVIRPWFEYGIFSMIYNSSKNNSNQGKKYLINQVILIHQNNNKAQILGYVLEPF